MGITRTARFAYGVVFTEGGHLAHDVDEPRGLVGLAGLNYDDSGSFFVFAKSTETVVSDRDLKLFTRMPPSLEHMIHGYEGYHPRCLPDDADEVLEAFIEKVHATGKREGPGWFLTLEEW